MELEKHGQQLVPLAEAQQTESLTSRQDGPCPMLAPGSNLSASSLSSKAEDSPFSWMADLCLLGLQNYQTESNPSCITRQGMGTFPLSYLSIFQPLISLSFNTKVLIEPFKIEQIYEI